MTSRIRRLALLAGPLAALAAGWALWESGYSDVMAWTAAVAVLCAIWWVFEPIPIPATSLLPMAVRSSCCCLEASCCHARWNAAGHIGAWRWAW